jgi:hypothetical protein
LIKESHAARLWHASQHASVTRESRRFTSHPADLALTVTFSLLDLLLAENFHLGLPFVSEMLVVVSPSRLETMHCFVGDFTAVSTH